MYIHVVCTSILSNIMFEFCERRLECNNFAFRIGGTVQTMAWDQNGERLAVVCQGEYRLCFIVVSIFFHSHSYAGFKAVEISPVNAFVCQVQ